MTRIFFLTLLLVQLGCVGSTTSEIAVRDTAVPLVVEPKKFDCASDISATIETRFNGDQLFERSGGSQNPDVEFIENLKTCPRNETIAGLVRLKSGEDPALSSKASYVLIKLGEDTDKNGEALLSNFKKLAPTPNVARSEAGSSFGQLELLLLINDVMENDAPEIVSNVFDLASDAEGGPGQYFAVMLANQFVRDPARFLLKLRTKPRRIKDDVIFAVFFGKKKQEIVEKLNSVPKNSNAGELADEMRRFALKNKYGL